MKHKFIIILFFSSLFACAQTKSDENVLFVSFWNLENLFDTYDDPGKNDQEFLPEGVKQWTDERLERKFYNLSRVIRSMNNSKGPDILGVCEVENKNLLDSLVNKFLFDKNYLTESPEAPDERGIQTGIIYNSQKLKLLQVYTDTVKLDQNIATRLILGLKFILNSSDTIYVFVNHWPSRRGGEIESESRRFIAAKTLRKRIDNILSENISAKIIIMGDFNDEPVNNSILNYLKAKPVICDSSEMLTQIKLQEDFSDLFNLSYSSFSKGEGSYKHQDDWNMLDQIIVSKDLIIGLKIRYLCNSFQVYKPDFMITKSGKYEGTPFPTFAGNRYLGGYSDHFPVTAMFKLEE
jgi:predicted extracellular nuclease